MVNLHIVITKQGTGISRKRLVSAVVERGGVNNAMLLFAHINHYGILSTGNLAHDGMIIR